jgi:hypothetical protein
MTETATPSRPAAYGNLDPDLSYEAHVEVEIDQETDHRALVLTVYEVSPNNRRQIAETPLLDAELTATSARQPSAVTLPTLISACMGVLGQLGLRTPAPEEWMVGVDYSGVWVRATCPVILRG